MVISAHPGIDLWSQHLTGKSWSAQNNSTYWTDNLSIRHIRIRIQGKNLKCFYIIDVACSIYLYLVLRRSVLMKGLYRGSYMSAHVLLILLNELGKRDKMRGLSSILSLFRNEFNKFNKT